MLDAARANALTKAINDAFAAIGGPGDTGMPKSKDNREPIAFEYHVASQLYRIAGPRRDKATAAAVKAGVMFDHEKQPLPVGSNALVFAGEVVEIACSVSNPASRVDTVALLDELVAKHRLPRAVADRLLREHTHENRAPHKFVSTLVTSR